MPILKNKDFFDKSGIYWLFSRENAIFEHSHEFFEIFVVTEGEFTHIVNNKEQRLSVGDCVFIRPTDTHTSKKQNEVFTLSNIAFTENICNTLIEYISPKGFENILNAPMPTSIKIKTSLLPKLSVYNHSVIQRKQILFSLFCEFSNNLSKKNVTLSAYLLEQMSQKENLFEGLPRLFELSGKSREHTSRIIKKELNITPTMLINNLRLSYATSLLLYTNIKIIDISFDIGYENLSYFYRIFKKTYGVSPSEYRKLHQKRLF